MIAKGKKTSTKNTEIGLGIFMVKRSMAAAKATAAGNTVRTATCIIPKTCPTLAGAG
jgi:hypothetical protein